MKCKNCGANFSGDFCQYCGAENEQAKKDRERANAPGIFGFDFGKFTASLSFAMDMQKTYEATGEISNIDMNDMSAGCSDIMSDINKSNQAMIKSAEDKKAKNKAARLAISNGKCPDCGAKFKKKQDSCAKCGAMLKIYLYND